MTIIRLFVSICLLILAGAPSGARADWINLTGAEISPNIAEIYVEEDHVRVVLEIYIGDIRVFEDLVPDDLISKPIAGRPDVGARLRRFSAKTFSVVTDDGERLEARLERVEPRLRKDRRSPFAGMINPFTRQRVPKAPADKRVLYAELAYPFKGRPESLTFIPPVDDRGLARVSIGFIAYHKAVPIIDFRYLSKRATVMLDWKDPWYTKFKNPRLKRHHASAMMSFLYVEPREVRHELLVRVRDLQEWTDLGLNNDARITSDEQTRIKKRARAFLVGRNPLKVDGTPSTPASSRAEFLNISLTGLQVIEGTKPIDLSTAILGVILSYPVKRLPQTVSVDWELFNDRVNRIPTSAIDPAGAFPSFIDSSDPTFKWRNFLRQYNEPKVSPVVIEAGRRIGVPLLTALFAVLALGAAVLAVRPVLLKRGVWISISGLSVVAAVSLGGVATIDITIPESGPPDEKTSAKIVTGVLSNVNHAYLEKDPAALRKALGVVVASDALTDVEAELGRALAIKVAGGGIARVKAIENLVLKDVASLDGRSGFRSVAEWVAQASAGHWGHAHRRTIRFRALVELVEQDGAWKLGGITVVDAKRQS